MDEFPNQIFYLLSSWYAIPLLQILTGINHNDKMVSPSRIYRHFKPNSFFSIVKELYLISTNGRWIPLK